METFHWILALCVLILAWYWHQKRQYLPPGPWNLPLLGYLPFLDPLHPYVTLTALAQKYGPIYGLHLGSVYTVVLSDAKLIRQVLNKDEASGRAPLHLTHGIMKGYGLICAQGDRWKDQRRFVYATLRTLGAARAAPNRKWMEQLIMEHVHDLVQHLSEFNGAPLDPLEPLRHSLGSAINFIVFGRAWSRNDPTWTWLQELQEEGTKLIGVAGPSNFLPFLRFLPNAKRTMQFLLTGKQKTHAIYKKLIEEEEQQYVSTKEPKNLIQAFIKERLKRPQHEADEFYSDEQFHHLLADVFGASLDTTLTTLRWYLLYLATHPSVQEDIRTELRQTIGGQAPTLSDIANLPYAEAALAETQRIRSVVPVGIPHGALAALDIGPFRIPAGAMVVPLQWALHMDPAAFPQPEEYRPGRFLDGSGAFSKPESFMPFQTGKRMCVGDELARMLLHLFGTTLVQRFVIECDDERVDLRGDCGITLTPKPHRLRFTKL